MILLIRCIRIVLMALHGKKNLHKSNAFYQFFWNLFSTLESFLPPYRYKACGLVLKIFLNIKFDILSQN